MKKTLLFLFISLISLANCLAQSEIIPNPDPTRLSSSTEYRFCQTNPPTSPKQGATYLDCDDNKVYMYFGTTWTWVLDTGSGSSYQTITETYTTATDNRLQFGNYFDFVRSGANTTGTLGDTTGGYINFNLTSLELKNGVISTFTLDNQGYAIFTGSNGILSNDFARYKNEAGDDSFLTIRVDGITGGDKTQSFPNADGVLALTVNGVSADSTGDITIPTGTGLTFSTTDSPLGDNGFSTIASNIEQLAGFDEDFGFTDNSGLTPPTVTMFLKDTGVTPGTYPNATVTVGADGRTTSVSAGTGSTDDQTMVEVSYNNGTSGLTATTGQAAVDEVYAAIPVVSNGVTYGSETASFTLTNTHFDNDILEITPTADMIVTIPTGLTSEKTTLNIQNLDDQYKITFEYDAGAVSGIYAETKVSDVEFPDPTVTLKRKAGDVYGFIGSGWKKYTPVVPTSEVYQADDAASPAGETEADEVDLAWWPAAAGTVTVGTTTDSHIGTYAHKFTTALANSSTRELHFPAEIGESYDVIIWGKSSNAAEDGVGDGFMSVDSSTASITAGSLGGVFLYTTYTQSTITMTANATTVELRVYPTASAEVGSYIIFDGVSIIKN